MRTTTTNLEQKRLEELERAMAKAVERGDEHTLSLLIIEHACIWGSSKPAALT